LKRLKLLSDAVAKAVERAPEKVDARGWLEVTIPIESVEHAAMELLKVGAECEVATAEGVKGANEARCRGSHDDLSVEK
jgi:hypothetical protein